MPRRDGEEPPVAPCSEPSSTRRSPAAAAGATRLRGVVAAIEEDGGLIRANESLLGAAANRASTHGLSGYDAAYVAAASAAGARLVSCDVRDLVSVGFAVSPGV